MRLVATWVVVLAFVGCGPVSSAQQPADSAARIQKLEDQVKTLQTQAAQTSFKVRNLAGEFGATVSVTDSGYSVLRTEFGTMLIAFERATPYADGVQVLLKIGNLTGANFSGVKLSIEYGPAPPNFDNGRAPAVGELTAYYNAQKHKDFDLTAEIPANRWSYVKFVIAPEKPESVHEMTISAAFSRMSMPTGPLPQ